MSDINRQSRWFLLCFGGFWSFVLLFVFGFVWGKLFPVFHWSGSQTLPVHVTVVDASTLQPVVGAQVVLFNGPHTPFEGPAARFEPVEFTPEHENAMPEESQTDSNGRAVMDRRFQAYGTDGYFSSTGRVNTSGVWVQVNAKNYATVTLPLDGQSIRLRDLEDEYPIYLTLLLASDVGASGKDDEPSL